MSQRPAHPTAASPHDPPWPPRPPEWRHDAGDPEQAFPVPFGALDAAAVIFWSVLAPFVVQILAYPLGLLPTAGADDAERAIPGLAILIATQVVTLAGGIGWLALRGALSWRVLGPVRPRPVAHVAMGVGLGGAGLLLVQVVAFMVDQIFGPFEAPEQFALQVATTSGAAIALALVAVIVLAPVIEEVMFRSLLFQSVRRKFGLTAGMVVSSLVFGFIHTELFLRVVDGGYVWAPNPAAIVGIVALGLWLAATFHVTGSLLVPITAHATYNALVLGFQLLLAVP